MTDETTDTEGVGVEQYQDEFFNQMLESRDISTERQERTKEEQDFFRKLMGPSNGWLHQVNLYEGSSSLVHTDNRVYRVTVEVEYEE